MEQCKAIRGGKLQERRLLRDTRCVVVLRPVVTDRVTIDHVGRIARAASDALRGLLEDDGRGLVARCIELYVQRNRPTVSPGAIPTSLR